MSSAIEARARKSFPPLDESDPWRYGWRYVKQTQPDGTVVTKQVPLNEEDVLHPQEDDFIVQNPLHTVNCETIELAVVQRLEGKPGYVWLRDCRVDWGVEGVEALGPDISVFSGVAGWERTEQGTFYVAQWNALPLLAIEVTSPTTRAGDLGAKVREYYRAHVPLYIIVDIDEDENSPQFLRLLCYRPGPTGYVLTELDEPGRLWVEPLGLWIVLEGNRVACFDEQGQRLGDYLHTVHQADAAERERLEAEQRTAAAERARVEAQQRAVAAERERLEAQQRIVAAERERLEAQQRAVAAERERLEADQRAAAAEAKMREMEEELRRLRGE